MIWFDEDRIKLDQDISFGEYIEEDILDLRINKTKKDPVGGNKDCLMYKKNLHVVMNKIPNPIGSSR